MAFTLALHHVSGFDAPIIVDTPVGRVSGKNRENFGEIAVRVSEKKQTILLLSGDEFSPNLQRVIAPAASNIYRLKMMPDEKSTEVVGM
jgi:DNA sulfur modification protein DndD